MYQRESNIVSIVAAFVIGSLIGAGVALLVAPQSGKKTRKIIMNKSMEIRDKALETAGDTRDRASKAFDGIAKNTKDRASSFSKMSMFGSRSPRNAWKKRVQAAVCD